MVKVLDEGNLRFDFSNCPVVAAPIKFDTNSPHGITSVDFIAETEDCVYFIEVKDFQNPYAPKEQHKADYEMIVAAGKEKSAVKDDLSLAKGTIFNFKIGQKIKDSLLRKYALGEEITKNIVYLVLINLDNLGKNERARLKDKISGHIPNGLNTDEYGSFTNITFKLVNAEQIKEYGITCTTKA